MRLSALHAHGAKNRTRRWLSSELGQDWQKLRPGCSFRARSAERSPLVALAVRCSTVYSNIHTTVVGCMYHHRGFRCSRWPELWPSQVISEVQKLGKNDKIT